MKITSNSLQSRSLQKTKNYKSADKNISSDKKQWKGISAYPTPFTGKCENLGYILNNYDSEIFPDRVWELAKEKGVESKETLYDVHKQAYMELKDCDTIEEAKFFFPEFSDVNSMDEVKWSKNSLVDKIKKGEIEGVKPDTDVPLALLKLLYADALSSPQVSSLFGSQIDNTAAKFNIKLMPLKYALVLKHSDSEFAKKHAEVLSNALTGIERARKGGPSPLKGRELSAKHKGQISAALKNYYSDPGNIRGGHKWSPELKETFSRVMKKAWEYAPVTKFKLSQYLKTKGVEPEKYESFEAMLESNSKKLKKFWAANPSSKSELGEGIRRSWAEYKGIEYTPKKSVKAGNKIILADTGEQINSSTPFSSMVELFKQKGNNRFLYLADRIQTMSQADLSKFGQAAIQGSPNETPEQTTQHLARLYKLLLMEKFEALDPKVANKLFSRMLSGHFELDRVKGVSSNNFERFSQEWKNATGVAMKDNAVHVDFDVDVFKTIPSELAYKIIDEKGGITISPEDLNKVFEATTTVLPETAQDLKLYKIFDEVMKTEVKNFN